MGIMDYCRVSVSCDTPLDVLSTLAAIRNFFEVVSVKNGFRAEGDAVPASGYRQVQVLAVLGFEERAAFPEGLKELGILPTDKLIVEIQILLTLWLNNKRMTSLN